MGQIVGASSSRGHLEPGDQTGTEVYVKNWFNDGWNVVLRPNNMTLGSQAASIAVRLADSNLVGYSQPKRTLLKNELSSVGWDVSKYIASGRKSCADCSAFVHTVYAVLISSLRSGGLCTTSTLSNVFPKHGFTVIRDRSYCTGYSKLLVGDLICATGKHVEMYVGDKNKLSSDIGNIGGDVSQYQMQFDRKDALLREVGYLTTSISPSISPTNVQLSLYNTTVFQAISDASSTTYNLDKLPQNCKIIVQYLINKGLNLAGALGIAANIKQESGWRPDAVNRSSGASGLCQWLGGRRTKMINYVGSNWKSNISRQLDFLWEEMQSSYKKVFSTVSSVPNTLDGAKQATEYFLRHFEIPGNYSKEVPRRNAIVTELWGKCSIIQVPQVGSSTSVIPNGSGKTVIVPSSVNQSGIIPNYTNYSYWYSKWAYTQRKIANEWANTGRNHIEYVASIGGYRLLACSPVFGNVGDKIKVTLSDGTSFGAIIADAKGGDAQSPWGHVLNGRVDIIEWEMKGTSSRATDSSTQSKMKLTGLKGKKVKSITNYGQYKKW